MNETELLYIVISIIFVMIMTVALKVTNPPRSGDRR